jgi:Ca-activated chloride channel homolog
MSLIAPLNLLFLSLIGAIVLLYVLRLRRKERVVSSTLLWQSALRDLQANAPWQKLRSSLLMWLQIAFLALAAFALARPAIKVLAPSGQTIAIVLDASGSMAATDVAPSRFGDALKKAEKLVMELSPGDRATIIQSGAQTHVLAPLTSDKGALKRALSRARTQDTSCNLREAIVLASSLLKNQKAASKGAGQIYVLSDGAVPPLAEIEAKDIGLQFIKIGKNSDNIGITAMDVRRDFSRAANNQIFVNVRNFANRPRTVQLELLRNNSLVAVEPMELPAYDRKKPDSGQKSHIFENLAFTQGLFTARFEEKDALASDNAAYTVLAPPQNLRVLLISDGNLFLERALNLDPFVQLFRGGKNEATSGQYNVVVIDGAAPANLPPSNQLVFNATTDLTPVNVTGTAPAPGVADWDRKHPVTRFAPWGDVRLARSQAVTLQPWGISLVEAERTPLVVAGEKKTSAGTKRVVWCGFDIRETDLPLRVAFPIFITNAVRWLGAAPGSTSEGTPRRPGEVVPLAPPQGISQVQIQAPDKSSSTLSVVDGQVLFAGADQVGVYTATGKGKSEWSQTFAVSLLSKSESDIQPGDALKVQDEKGEKSLQGEPNARANRELWALIIFGALALLAAEWWVYHRGV